MATEIVVTKIFDEVENNSDTLQDDAELKFAVGANETWFFRLIFLFDTESTPQLKAGFTAPSGATIRWSFGTFGSALLTESETRVYTSIGTGVQNMGAVGGIIQVGSNAGNLQLQWAQNVADASDTTVQKGSMLMGHKV